MTTNKKFSLLYKKQVFYSIAFALTALGTYIAYIVENRYKIFASGILGIVVPYLLYAAFVKPKSTTNKIVELEDLEFPRDIKYLFFGFLWVMIMYWGVSLTLDLARYLLQ